MKRLVAFIGIGIIVLGLSMANGDNGDGTGGSSDNTSDAESTAPVRGIAGQIAAIASAVPTLEPTAEPTQAVEPTQTVEATRLTDATQTAEPTQQPVPEEVEVLGVEFIDMLTGPQSPSRTDIHWNIGGTDLGFTFEHEGKLYMVFGDTWGRDGVEGDDWRSNIMVMVEPDPEHIYLITDAITDENGEAAELLPSLKIPEEEYTVIPNTGIAVGDRMYIQYMSVRDWIKHPWNYKEPVINGSGIAYSDDGGHTWIQDETAYWEGNSDFAEAGMVKHDGYVYVFGTPAGRLGPAKLFRTPEDALLETDQWEYWAGGDWSDDPELAAEVVPAPVGELSVRWSERHQRWLMMYKNEETHNIVLRTAEQLEGPWDDERDVVWAHDYPTLYAPMMFPIEGDGDTVYFGMSMFLPIYQVFLMEMTLN